jgi:hypothetical protein
MQEDAVNRLSAARGQIGSKMFGILGGIPLKMTEKLETDD